MTRRKILWVGVLMLVLCGCERRQAPAAHAKAADAIDRVVEKFSHGGEGWSWMQYPEIKKEVLAITNVDERARTILASAEMIASMDLLGLPQRERISVAPKYWALTSQFYDLLVVDEISDAQRVKYLLVFLNTFRALCLSLPLCAQMSDETESDFLERRFWARDLYSEYYNFASRWHRVYKPHVLSTIPSVCEGDFDKMTRFVCDFPSKEAFLSSPVFTEELRGSGKARTVKSPVLCGRHPFACKGIKNHAYEAPEISNSSQRSIQTDKDKLK